MPVLMALTASDAEAETGGAAAASDAPFNLNCLLCGSMSADLLNASSAGSGDGRKLRRKAKEEAEEKIR